MFFWCMLAVVAASAATSRKLGQSLPATFETALQVIASLREEISMLEISLFECIQAETRDREIDNRALQDECCPCGSEGTMGTDINTTNDTAARDVNWNVQSGDCVLHNDCLSSPAYPESYGGEQHCAISIEADWSGHLEVHSFNVEACCDFLRVDDTWYYTSSGLQGTVPTGSIEWSSNAIVQDKGWMICRSNSSTRPQMQELWRVTAGNCKVDGQNCITSPNFPNNYDDLDACTIVVASNWTGVLEVSAFSTDFGGDFLYVNNQSYNNEFYGTWGLSGLIPSGEIRWSSDAGWTSSGWKLCQGQGEVRSTPWEGETWTCQISGAPCELPFEVFHTPFLACTTYFSDVADENMNWALHDGYPTCGPHVCGPCSCGAGQAQGYDDFELPGLSPVSYIRCTACFPGKFRSVGGLGAADACQSCAPGYASSEEGGTACASCLPGRFSEEGAEACLPCPPGSFGDGRGRTGCTECAVGRFGSRWGVTGCEECLAGHITVETGRSACTGCVPGQFTGSTSMTECALCRVGTFSDVPGQSYCHNCSEILNPGDSDTHLWTTMKQQMWKGQMEWVNFEGAESANQCGCAEGSWLSLSGQCAECGEGMICKGMGTVEIQSGYFAPYDDAGWVWRCYGDSLRCPGGVPGSCAARRDNTSIACGNCEPNFRASTEGPCEPCGGSNLSFLVLAFLCLLVVLSCIYYFVATEDRAKEKGSVALIAIMWSQFVTVLQMMGVFDQLSVTWPATFATILNLANLFNLRLDMLNVDCVVPWPPVARYVGAAFGFVSLLVIMVALHISFVVLFRARQLRVAGLAEFVPALVGAIGTISMSFIISVCTTIFAPFQCEAHPNGELTVEAYPQVACGSLANGQYGTMVTVGIVASLFPLGFISLCVWVVTRLPYRLRQGDTAFLHSFAFLFFRFRPGAYWYVLVLLLRNTLVALTPMISESSLELFFLVGLFVPCVITGSKVMPWRVLSVTWGILVVHASAHLCRSVQRHVQTRVSSVVIFQCCGESGAGRWTIF